MDCQDSEVDVVVGPAPDVIVWLHAFERQKEKGDVSQKQESKSHCDHDNREGIVHV